MQANTMLCLDMLKSQFHMGNSHVIPMGPNLHVQSQKLGPNLHVQSQNLAIYF